MNWLDIAIIVILAFLAIIGLRTGIIKTVFSLAGLVAGVYLAGQYYVPLSGQLPFSEANIAKIVAFAIILIAVMVVGGILASVVQRFVRWVMLGWVDGLGGAVFGLAIGATICGALLAAVAKFPFIDMEAIISQSHLAALLVDRFPLLLALLPEEFDAVRSFFQ